MEFFYICIYFCFFKVGFILCHGILNTDATALNLWKLALQSSSCLSLFRDEVFHIHKAAEDLFVNIRGYGIFIYLVFFWRRVMSGLSLLKFGDREGSCHARRYHLYSLTGHSTFFFFLKQSSRYGSIHMFYR